MITRIRKILLIIIENIKCLPRDYYNVLSRKNIKYEMSGILEKSKNIAIINIFPGTSSVQSVMRTVKALQKNGYFIISVFPENSEREEWISYFSNQVDLIITKENHGFDFGSYKLGVYILQKNNLIESLENLVIANDSIYYTDDSEKMLNKILNPKSRFNTLFINRSPVFHAGSFLIKFDLNKIDKKKFIHFWNFYVPSSNKRKVIIQGEHKLSKIVGKEYFKSPLDKLLFQKNLPPLNQIENCQMAIWLDRNRRSNLIAFAKESNSFDQSYLISDLVYNEHISNALGLYLCRIFHAPLKMDLTKLGLVSPLGFIETLVEQRIEATEIEFLKNKLISFESFYKQAVFLSV